MLVRSKGQDGHGVCSNGCKGVAYDSRRGRAGCPHCDNSWAPVRNVMPWDGDMRVRFHVCRQCGKSFKSIESMKENDNRGIHGA